MNTKQIESPENRGRRRAGRVRAVPAVEPIPGELYDVAFYEEQNRRLNRQRAVKAEEAAIRRPARARPTAAGKKIELRLTDSEIRVLESHAADEARRSGPDPARRTLWGKVHRATLAAMV